MKKQVLVESILGHTANYSYDWYYDDYVALNYTRKELEELDMFTLKVIWSEYAGMNDSEYKEFIKA